MRDLKERGNQPAHLEGLSGRHPRRAVTLRGKLTAQFAAGVVGVLAWNWRDAEHGGASDSGYGGSGGWADPQTGLSLGFVTNRIGSVSTPLGDLNLFRLTGLVRRAAEQSGLASPAAGRAA